MVERGPSVGTAVSKLLTARDDKRVVQKRKGGSGRRPGRNKNKKDEREI